MTLQAGKRYRTRGGLITPPLRKSSSNTNYKFEARMNDGEHKIPSVLSWLPNGHYLTQLQECRYDLIEEV